MTLPPIVPGRPEDDYGLPIAPTYQDPPVVHQPPPQVVYVYQPQQAQQVTKGIWDFIFQWWVLMGAIVLFFLVCCAGVFVIGQIGGRA